MGERARHARPSLLWKRWIATTGPEGLAAEALHVGVAGPRSRASAAVPSRSGSAGSPIARLLPMPPVTTPGSASGPQHPLGGSWVAQLRVLTLTVVGGLVVIGVALAFVLPLDESPPSWFTVAALAAGVVLHLGLDAFGYRTTPLDPALPADRATAVAMERYRAGMILRSALCESIAVASVALAFVLPVGGFAVYGVGAGVSVALLGIHVWPGPRPVDRAATALEAHGTPSGLREALGPGGTVS